MTPFLSKWYGAILLSSLFLALLVLSLLPTRQAFAHASGEKHAARTSLSVTYTPARARPSGRQTSPALHSQRPADEDGCQFEDCNGEDPSSNGCTDLTQLHLVSFAYIRGPNGGIGQVRIWESAACGAYFAEVDSFVGAQTEVVDIQRDAGQPDALSFGSDPRHGVGLLSRMVGIKGEPIRATGMIRYGRLYSAPAYYSAP